jgi:hypothetical protein
VGSSFVESFCS